MDIRQLIKRVTEPTPVIGVCALLVVSLSYLIIQSFGVDESGELQYWIFIIGGTGIVVLTFFLLVNWYRLYQDYSRNEIGSKLTTKLVLIFFLLTVIPFALIYYFSIQFLSKGVDGWFDVQVEQTVQDARFLGEAWLEGVQLDITTDVENFAKSISEDIANGQMNKVLRLLDEVRELENYEELSIHTDDGRILAFSHAETDRIMPDSPGAEVFVELRIQQTYASLEPINNSAQQFRVVAPIANNRPSSNVYALQAIKLLPLSYANLASSVETALGKYDQMVFSRAPLRYSLVLTLTLISLASLLFSILTAVYLSKRLVAPISNLAAGTQKIAEGNYGTHLPVTSTDELGILTDSFNDMSSKIQDAQRDVLNSQLETERQKGYLEAVLTNLSSGVFSLDTEQCLQVCNSAACDILDLDHSELINKTLTELGSHHLKLAKFFNIIAESINSDRQTWQEEVTILGAHGRQILILRGSALRIASQDNSESRENVVLVFDDVTNLIQAQRDAAWGEVARRLAHEIKNPLTPIQLSAERISNKFASQVEGEMRETLERSARTIVQQVESMKEMVNAFSSYAQPVRATLQALNINNLIRDVVELHASTLSNVEVCLQLNERVPEIKANANALSQVLNNLIINAGHALDGQAKPYLSITSEMAPESVGNYVDIVIQDNGIGVPDEIRGSLFDPYVSSKTKGSGLGLAIVKRIVEEHSGSVWCDVSNDQSGTAMHVRLPINALQTYRGNRAQNTLHSAQS